MRPLAGLVIFFCLGISLTAQDSPAASIGKKAQKSYQQGLQYLQSHDYRLALWYFRDANKRDGRHCLLCQEQMVQTGLKVGDWEAVEDGASGLASEVKEPQQQAVAHYYIGLALMNDALAKHQSDLLTRAHDEFSKATALYPHLPDVPFNDGKTLAQMHRDDEAKAEFQSFLSMAPESDPRRRRALQFIQKPELARANLAPDFLIYTADGQLVSLSDLAGKVVLVQFWASWCDVCTRALPHLREIAKKLQDQPFVILSVSVDHDENAWHSFLAKNDVPGLQYRDGFNGPLAQAFGIGLKIQSSVQNPVGGLWQSSWGLKQPVPKTFTIDADGVLQAEKMSDSLDQELQSLLQRAAAKSQAHN